MEYGIKNMDFCHSREVNLANMENSCWILPLKQKSIKESKKKESKKGLYKAAEAAGEFMGNKIADKNVKPKPVIGENRRNVEEIIIRLKTEKNIQ